MKRKIISIILIFMLILGTLATIVKATDANLNLGRTTGTLTITKIQQENNVQSPLAGVTFDIYKIADDEESTDIPTDADILATKQSKTTGADGIVKFENLELGRYLVVESNAPANVVTKIANFIVDIPMTETDGTTLNYDVEVSPKNNTVYGGFVLRKQDEAGNALGGVNFELQKYNETNSVWEAYGNPSILTTAEEGELASDGVTELEEGSITLTGLPAAKYRFIETSALEGYILDNKTTYDFEVSLGDDGNTKVEPATITVVNEKPELEKEIVTSLVNGSADIGDEIEFKVTTDVPSTIANLETYTVEDVLPEGLTYDNTSLIIKGIAEDNTETTLGTGDYVASYDESTRKITITFTNVNLEAYKTLEATYTATLNRSSDATTLGNTSTATLTYSNIVTTNYDDETNTQGTYNTSKSVTVKTGGFWIEKRAQSATGELLQGAVFKMAVSEADAKAGNYLSKEDGTEIVLETGADGTVSYKGLTYGTYWLVEVQAPSYTVGEGDAKETKYYNLLRKPVEISVGEDTYTSSTAASIIINKKGFQLPATGGVGTAITVLIGMVLVIFGIIVFKRKREEENN